MAENSDSFSRFLRRNHRQVRRWPLWKRSLLGGPRTHYGECPNCHSGVVLTPAFEDLPALYECTNPSCIFHRGFTREERALFPKLFPQVQPPSPQEVAADLMRGIRYTLEEDGQRTGATEALITYDDLYRLLVGAGYLARGEKIPEGIADREYEPRTLDSF